MDSEVIARAAHQIMNSDAILIGAGAGMGVDSGLPDFRGAEGFWAAYPPFRGKNFSEISNPQWFDRDPKLAWGFFGHRLNLYRQAMPHAGFQILKRWSQAKPHNCFVFTSNVDGQFQKAGFDDEQVIECHGSIHFLQCSRPCSQHIWPADNLEIEVDEATIQASSQLPICPNCGRIARPNILMFYDGQWISKRTDAQLMRYNEWLSSIDSRKLVMIELGAGLAIPTVRFAMESARGTLIRINPREPHVHKGIAIPLGALEALQLIDQLI